MKFETARILFPLVITIHNLEEAIWLPGFTQTVKSISYPVDKHEFHFAIFVLTAAAYIIAFLSRLGGKESIATYLLTGYAAGMLINVFIPHIAVTLLLGKYMPGLITALLLNLPATFILIYTAIKQNHVKLKQFIAAGVFTSVILLISLPFLFFAGKLIFN